MSEGFSHFKFMYQRFLTSTFGWKEEEQGAYLRLLIVQMDQGGIPADLKSIGAISPVAKKIWVKKLAHKFRHINADGTLYNAVMKEVRDDAVEKTQANKKNGHLGGRPKKNRTVIAEKPNGFENNNRNESETKAKPVTSNHKPIKEKDKKENWDCYPGPETVILLEEVEINAAAEFIYRLKQTALAGDRLIDYWKAFLVNLTGKKFYQDKSDLVQHFRNWLKDQKLETIKQETQSTGLSAREKRDQDNYEKEFGKD